MNVVNEGEDVAGVGHREPAQGKVEKEIEDEGKHRQLVSRSSSHLKTVVN